MKRDIKKIRGYCASCLSLCPTVAHVQDGVLVKVEADQEHPLCCGICPKASAAPELVYNEQRLQYPMRRTNPKDEPVAQWEKITWEEALDTITRKLSEIKAVSGPEAVAITRSSPGGSPMTEIGAWVTRLARAFGTPNSYMPTHVCQWHRDWASAYTFGGRKFSQGWAEFENASCILIWGTNPHETNLFLVPSIRQGLEKGAKLIVIDPRKTEMASIADMWLQVSPGTDGALALSMIHVIIEEGLYDEAFVRDWTTAPFLARSDTGNLLRASDISAEGDPPRLVAVDTASKKAVVCSQGNVPTAGLSLESVLEISLVDDRKVSCKTVFSLLRERAAEYAPKKIKNITGIPEDKIKAAARMYATIKPACWYSWNGIEQSMNATQTNRAICILYALTGNYDVPGGNAVFPRPPVNPIEGKELLSPEQEKKRLGFLERPLGPGGEFGMSTQGYEVNKAILTGHPYPIRALLNFGANLINSSAQPSAQGTKDALAKLEFHVDVELFLSPTAELADIVLPAASSWESWHAGVKMHPLGEKAYYLFRPAVVPSPHESWPDMKIIFELARRLGLGDKFWDGDAEAAFNHHFAPAGITVEQLKISKSDISQDMAMKHQKYRERNDGVNYSGFPTPSKRIELYSSKLQEHGHNPLPSWIEPFSLCLKGNNENSNYPLIFTSGKVVEYCHSQHRGLPSLRKRVPHPFVELNPLKAKELGIEDGEWVVIETPQGSITVKAKLADGIASHVLWSPHGWWQPCPELDLPGYDPYDPKGANANVLFNTEPMDPISGSLQLRGYPCNIKKAD